MTEATDTIIQTTPHAAATAADSAPDSAPAAPAWSWATPEGKLADGWADHLPDDLKPQASQVVALVEKYQGSIPQLLKGAINLQSVASRKIGAPQPDWSPEQLAEYRAAHGIPEAADKYDLTPPEGALPEGWSWNPEVFAPMKDWALRNHIPAAALKEWTGIQAGVDQARQKAAMEMVAQTDAQTVEALKKEFGPSQFDATIERAERACKYFGIESDVTKNPIANHPEFIKLLARVAAKMGESVLATSSTVASDRPGKLRAAEIMNPNGTDPLTADYFGKNGYDRQVAAQKVLHDLMTNG